MKKYDNLKIKAIELRYNGKSLQDICLELSVPKGTVYEWIKDIPLQRPSKSLEALKIATKNREHKKNTDDIINEVLFLRSENKSIYEIKEILNISSSSIDRIFKEYNIGKLNFKQINESKWIEEANKFFLDYKDNSLFMLGLGLYWGEGSKLTSGRGALELCNSDVGIISSWIKWCNYFLPNRDLKFKLNLHDLEFREQALSFWKEKCHIQPEKIKVYVLKKRSKNPKIKIPNGVLYVRVGKGSMEDLIKMTCWLDILRSN